MRFALASLALGLLGACAATDTTTLTSADAATSLAVGERMTMARRTTGGGGGSDPLVILTLTHADGRAMQFEEANHTPHDVMVQGADGPLAQAMGLFGGETPTLYRPRDDAPPFICAPDGPAAIGVHRATDGGVSIVGLKENPQVETRADGSYEALPLSPDMVCARLRLRAQ
jgi:hypothetical protein